MTIIHQAIKLSYARAYVPELTGPDNRVRDKPVYCVIARETDNPDRPDLPWRTSYRLENGATCAFRSSFAPRITFRDPAAYAELIKLHDMFRVRNIPLDLMFQGAVCGIVLNEYPKADETILQLAELVFDDLETLNINGDRQS
jgi:hypothetical protein